MGGGDRRDGRAAGHVHADETSWQVFEDIEGKDGHRWWLSVFATDQTTVFVMDPSAAPGSPPASWASTGNNHSWRPAGGWSSPRTSTRPTSRWPASTASPRVVFAHIRRYFLRAGAAHPEALGEWSTVDQRIAVLYRAHHALAATTTGTDATRMRRPLAAGLRRDRRAPHTAGQRRRKGPAAPGRRQGHRHADNEWDGLARHQQLPQLPLDNNTAEQALRTPVIGRKALRLRRRTGRPPGRRRLDRHATAARHGIEPLGLLTSYLHECARNGGAAPAGADLDPYLPWTPQGRARRRPASDPGPGP